MSKSGVWPSCSLDLSGSSIGEWVVVGRGETGRTTGLADGEGSPRTPLLLRLSVDLGLRWSVMVDAVVG